GDWRPPNAGMESPPSGTGRRVPETPTWATWMALGSLTARTPLSMANGDMALSPVQPWQLAQAPSKTTLPRRSGDAPALCEAGAGGAQVAGRAVGDAGGPPGKDGATGGNAPGGRGVGL